MTAVKMDKETASNTSDKNPCFLGNEELNPYLRLSDCSQVSDGGAALILVSEEGLKKLGKSPSDAMELVGIDHSTGNLYEDSDPLKLDTTEAAANKAYEMSGLSSDDINVAEVHSLILTITYSPIFLSFLLKTTAVLCVVLPQKKSCDFFEFPSINTS